MKHQTTHPLNLAEPWRTTAKRLQRLADSPLLAPVAQDTHADLDGLFGDSRLQLDLVDLARKAKP